jgi:DNA-binding transcriptional LysR family regulator
MEQAELDLKAASSVPRGALRVACFATFAKAHLLPAVVRLRKRYPLLQVIVCELETRNAIEAVRSGACDLAVAFSYNVVARPELPGLTSVPLLEERVLLALPRKWRRPREPFALKQLAQEEWIAGSSGSDDHLMADRACSMAGFLPRITHTFDDYDLLLRMVAAGFGVGFVPELGLRCPSAKSVVVRTPAGTPLSRRIYAVVRHSLAAQPPVQALLEELRGAL